MNSFQKLAYEIRRGQVLREKIAKWTPAMQQSLVNLQSIPEAQRTAQQAAQIKYLESAATAHSAGRGAARQFSAGNRMDAWARQVPTDPRAFRAGTPQTKIQENIARSNVLRGEAAARLQSGFGMSELGREAKQVAPTLQQGTGSVAATDARTGVRSPAQQAAYLEQQAIARQAAGVDQYGRQVNKSMLQRFKSLPTKGKAGLAAGGLGLLGLGAYTALD